MKEQTPTDFLIELYNNAMSVVGSKVTITSDLSQSEKELLDIVLNYSEQAKGVLSVIITSITYKALHPEQDIRNHQASIAGGYSGRTFDKKYITPFMKEYKFPSMADSGWLTRALEHKVPYDKNYSGAIKPKKLKPVFLDILDKIENGADCTSYLSYLFQGLIIKRNKQRIDLAKPTTLAINSILHLLDQHFNGSYKAEGASRLPVLAIYAAYQCLINEAKRFEGKELLPIESHTSSDKSSGRIGDIDILDERQRAFEAVEVKHGISITLQLVQDAYKKFQTTPVDRYYILSTAYPDKDEYSKIEAEIQRIKNVHGCQLIVNGIMPTLKYYLRLLTNTFEFIDNYVNLIEADQALKFEHKEGWNKLISEMK
ncbi:MAG: DNA methyltransferase [Bacteroidetes bacterium]|nr:DNA methyltransferase [Bacteroidota bacterium]